MTAAEQAGGVALRPYQHDVIDGARARIRSGNRRLILVAPTGAGKTIMAAGIIERAVARGTRVLFLAHRRELIQQAKLKLWQAARVDAGVIMAGEPMRPDQPVQVASTPTLHARAIRSCAMDLPPADLVFVDEAHRARAATYEKLLERYPMAAVLGLTATPVRGDGKGLGNLFDDMVECPDVPQLTEMGFLVPSICYAPAAPDLEGVETRRGDYVESQLAQRMDDQTLIGDIVEHWQRIAGDRRTVVFASGVSHSVHIRDEFRRSGVVAEHIDGNTPTEERDRILADLAAGRVQVVSNCMVLTEGWDCPDVAVCVLARPTKNMGLFRQMIGRVLRTAPGKDDAIVLDHSGAVHMHGLPDDPIEWPLSQDQKAKNELQGARQRGEAPALKDCPECHALRKAGDPCRVCGWKPKTKAEAPEVLDGDLARVDRSGQHAQEWDRASFYRQLLYIARERGYKDGWAANKYKEKFWNWPNLRKVTETPEPSVRRWVKSRQIAFAKAQKARQAGVAA